MVRQQQDRETANQQQQPRENDDGASDSHEGRPKEPAPKRHKRGKYVSKACGQCQRRKIKCDGCIPCQPCVVYGRDCLMQTVDMRRRRTTALTEFRVPSQELANADAGLHTSHDDQSELAVKDLASRLSRIEQQLSLVLESVGRDRNSPLDKGPGTDGSTNLRGATKRRPVNSDISAAVRSQVPAFLGESSINHTLDQIEGYLGHTDVTYAPAEHLTSSQASGTSLTAPSSPLSGSRETREAVDIRKVLNTYGIDPRREEWDGYMRTFCEEVHILYPFLHTPSLWANYTIMWNSSFNSLSPITEHEFQRGKDYRMVVAQVWVCIALGRCTESPRVSSEEGKHSAGWSIFEAAMDLIGDPVGCFGTCSRPAITLQTYALVVVYLFRLDANERAEKFLALAISHAHHLGFHRSKVVRRFPVFKDEMIRRLWWSLYALDRRLSIETGHPFLIQDVNVDAPHPQNLDDEWLNLHKDDPKTGGELEQEIKAALSKGSITPIPYLAATIRYSRGVGKIWEAIYGVNTTDVIPSSSLQEYLDQLISRAQVDVQPEFSDSHQSEPPNLERSNPLRWLTKQQMLMRIRWLSLRLLIRKPILQQRASPQESITDTLETEVTCIRIASNIIHEFRKIPQYAASAYPFIHSLVGATVIALGLIIREPSFKAKYGSITLHAASSLESYCRTTWVSGKMIRTIRRLNQITSSVLSDPRNKAPSRPVLRTPSHNQNTNAIAAPQTAAWTLPTTLPLQNHASQSSAVPGSYIPISALTNQNTNSLGKSPVHDSHSMAPSAAHLVPEGWTVTPMNLVTTDFDFEQNLTTDLVPGGHVYGWMTGDQPVEVPPDGTGYMEMGWLESWLGLT
ncbi:fungal-specific transcription factor domain-containing protein [Aspergillus bertholletiae]|uniref:Fungal-specific transcription factor domain-containing protein n=1 Tax=Aspergillus bertholletiae TaxID=1226010 RepID=A0A5N7AQ87_9EURO|nr:fungal-specific transcription factor domain-containing protein [Aspergillus bertholletiae]